MEGAGAKVVVAEGLDHALEVLEGWRLLLGTSRQPASGGGRLCRRPGLMP